MDHIRSYLLTSAVALVAISTTPAYAQAESQRQINIQAGPASERIPMFAQQAGLQILAPKSELQGRWTNGVSGRMTPRQALQQLLNGSALKIRSDNGRVITLESAEQNSNLVRVAVAQDDIRAPASAAVAKTAPPEEAVEAIVVTGSRLQNQGFTAPTPVTVIGSKAIQARAPSAIADVLNEIPSYRQTSGTSQNQRQSNLISPAQNLVDLRGLGASRTLVLVDGRRFVGSNNAGTVDTALIPASLVERVDVVTGGASAAYGSDAVAGVTNFILKDRLTGFQANTLFGRSDHGDNIEYGASFSGGRSLFDGRVHFIAGLEYNRNQGIGTIYSRDWASIEPGNTSTPINFGAARASGIPAAGFLPNVEFAVQTRGGIINTARNAAGQTVTALNQLAFNPDGSTYKLVRGTIYGNLMAGVTTNKGAGPIANWPLRVPMARLATLGRVTFDVNDDTTAFVEVNAGHEDINSFSNFSQMPVATILIDNPYLPAALRNQMLAANVTQIDIGRVNTEIDGLIQHANLDSARVAAGVRGKIFGDWDWDVYGQVGRTNLHGRLHYSREANVQAAIYAVRDPSGQIVCGTTATNPNFAAGRLTALSDPKFVQPGCQPFNPFGVGNVSPQAIDYMSGWMDTVSKVKQDVFAANFSGSPFSVWAGPVSVAFGAEYRKDRLSQAVDPLQQLGIYTLGNNKNYAGSNTIKEAYVEVGIPLLRDAPFAKSVDLNGAARRTDYRNSGAVTTWKIGGTWEVNDSIRTRFTQSRDIRAPNLSELYSVGGTTTFASTFNPFTGASGRLTSTNSGNPNLTPEIGDTFTAGIVFQPKWEWGRGLRASVDFYRIELHDVIASVPAEEVLNRCYLGFNEYCSVIEFDNSPLGIRNIKTGPFNQSVLNTDGIDMEVSYAVPMANLDLPGNLNLRALATWVDDLERVDRAGATFSRVDYAGAVNPAGGVPSWSALFGVDYTLNRVTLGAQVRTFSAFKYDPRLKGPGDDGYNPSAANSININRFPSLAYLHLNAAYDFTLDGHKMQAFGVVNNVTNVEPPALSIAAVNSGGSPYDFIGRTYKFGLRMTW